MTKLQILTSKFTNLLCHFTAHTTLPCISQRLNSTQGILNESVDREYRTLIFNWSCCFYVSCIQIEKRKAISSNHALIWANQTTATRLIVQTVPIVLLYLKKSIDWFSHKIHSYSCHQICVTNYQHFLFISSEQGTVWGDIFYQLSFFAQPDCMSKHALKHNKHEWNYNHVFYSTVFMACVGYHILITVIS